MQHEESGLLATLAGRRLDILVAADRYGRPLTSEEYWWIGVGLAACIMAEINERDFQVGRIEQLVDRLGYQGRSGDWLQRFVEELAELDAEGLLWPVWSREGNQPVQPTGLEIQPNFGPEEAYWLALAHVAVAVSVLQENQAAIDQLTEAILALVEQGLTPEHPALIQSILTAAEAAAGESVDEEGGAE
ncbi:MAG TPA: hypothetical protein VK191_14970 [Symbiobacteriaceae bacterium]|nr:hypothetical protein [Symbiobacteriaceae bacterium]